jgi:hypothetical protein
MNDRQSTYEHLDAASANYAATRDELRRLLLELREELARIALKHRGEIIAALDAAANARQLLRDLIDANRGYFTVPRTQQLHGIKVGLKKMPGRLSYVDEERVIAEIRAHPRLRTRVAALVRSRESLVAAAIRELPANELAAIGCSITEVDDEIVCDAVHTDVDKLLASVVSDATNSDELAAATKRAGGVR